MFSTNTSHSLPIAHAHYNWSFLRPTLSGSTGVLIGLMIANILGWV